MDYVQALFSFFIAPLFGTVVLGMLWKRITSAGGFWGLLAGTLSSIGMFIWVKLQPSALAYIALSPHAKDMAENMYRALWSSFIRYHGNHPCQLPHQAKAHRRADGAGLRVYENA